MFSIINTRSNPAYLTSMYALRHRVFRERLGWEVGSDNGQERDSFDAPDTRYLVEISNGQVTACVRVMPTTGANMLADVFPQLLDGRPVPCAKNIWEISRFAVDTSTNSNGYLSYLTARLLIGLLEFAIDRGLIGYVAVIDLRMERIIRRSGCIVHRLGVPQQIGKTKAIAIYAEANQQILTAVRKKTSISESPEALACA